MTTQSREGDRKMNQNDAHVLRELGKRVAAAAALEINAQTISLWKRLNGLQRVRPLIILDQLPWNQLNDTGELTLQCEDEFLRSLECQLRQRLYRFHHIRGDWVMHNEVTISRAIHYQMGPATHEQTLVTDADDGVCSHHYDDQLPDEQALDRIAMPVVTVDEALDRKRFEMAANIFGDILPVRLRGLDPSYSVHGGPWDRITTLRGADNVIQDLADRPDFTRKVIAKFAAMWNSMIDQYERLGLYEADCPMVHCTGAYSDELPSKDYDGQHAKAKDIWIFGLAQIFAVVSPEMHDEFEIQPMKPVLERFGLVYYGCCDPMDRKIDILRKIRNVRKVSVSPWADAERAAANIAGAYVFSAKPNPSYVAMDTFDPELVRKELKHIVSVCRKYCTPCELILKDVSTVRHQPERLRTWERIAHEVAEEG
jgi:hypothetical protein